MARMRRDRVKKAQSASKDDRVKFVEELISFGMIGKEDSGVIGEYNRGIRYWKGEHKITQRDPSKGNKAYNKFSEIVETRLSHLTDARPKWIFRPQEANDRLIAHALQQIVGDVIWDYIEWDVGEDGGGKAEDSVLHAAFCGSSHIKTVIDIHNGYPNFEVIGPGALIPDPAAKKKKKLRFWIHLVAQSVEHIKREYGVEVEPQVDLERMRQKDRADFHSPQISAQIDFTSETMPSTPFKITGKDGQAAFGGDPLGRAVVAECWMEDHSLERIPYDESETGVEHDVMKALQFPMVSVDNNHIKHIEAHEKFRGSLDPNTESEVITVVDAHIELHQQFPQETTRRKYPYGRVVTICQGKLLRDDKNPFGVIGLDFRDVLIKWDYFKNPESYWGKPMTTDLFGPQDDLNHRRNSITQNINLLNNGVRKIKQSLYKSLGLDKNPGRIKNLIGQVIPFINSPDEFTTEFGNPMPSHIWADVQWTERFMETQSMHQDAAAGRLPAAGTANVTLETLLGEFKTILRKPLRHYAGALSEMGRNAVLIMAYFMDDEEKFTILGEDQKTYEQIRWGDIKDRAALMRNVRIDTANMLPTSRMETFRKAIEMMQAGVPPEAAIQLLDDPKVIQVMQTMSQINQLAAQLQQVGEENEQLKQIVNTMQNRMQGDGGMGNVGSL